jgi:hypothetical protein
MIMRDEYKNAPLFVGTYPDRPVCRQDCLGSETRLDHAESGCARGISFVSLESPSFHSTVGGQQINMLVSLRIRISFFTLGVEA